MLRNILKRAGVLLARAPLETGQLLRSCRGAIGRPGFAAYGIALLLELCGFAAALCHPIQAGGALLLLAVHVAACAVMALALQSFLPAAQQQPRAAGWLLLLTVCLFIPALGPVGLLAGLLPALHNPKPPPPPPPWLLVRYPDMPSQAPALAARPDYADGALSAMLRYCPSPERRLAAVMAARQLRDDNEAEVLRLALTDQVDDVRLLAYSILDRKEQTQNALLKSLLAQLQAASADRGQAAKLHKRLAQTHYKLIELGLSQGEVQNYLLAEARRHIDAALQERPEDGESVFLLGSIALRQEEFDAAEKAFLRAQVLGMSLEKVLPCLAEIAFRQRRFQMVTHYLRALDPLYLRTQPKLGGVAAHWLSEESVCPPQ